MNTKTQTFHLQLATDDLSDNARQLHTTVVQLSHIDVQVHVSLITEHEPRLQLMYQVNMPPSLSKRLQWPNWEWRSTRFTDYLWEHTCLECFIATDTTNYFEVNASPNGAYALYTFTDYRTPNTLPPQPLYLTDQNSLASITWAEPLSHHPSDQSDQNEGYQRSFTIPLAALPDGILRASHHTLLHPCVILQIDETLLYFAPTHAIPPDFHQRKLWSSFIA